jgi:hypothetical protein
MTKINKKAFQLRGMDVKYIINNHGNHHHNRPVFNNERKNDPYLFGKIKLMVILAGGNFKNPSFLETGEFVIVRRMGSDPVLIGG